MDTEHFSNFEEVVEKALDKLAADKNDRTLSWLSEVNRHGNEESKMERQESIRAAIRRRQSEYMARKETKKWAANQKPALVPTISEE